MTLSLHIPPYLFLFAASIILLCNAFALRHKISLTPIEKTGVVAGIVFGIIGGLTFLAGTDFIIPFIWRGVILGIGLIIIILSLFLHRFTRVIAIRLPHIFTRGKAVSQIQNTSPSINYGRIIVRNTTHKMHGGIYDDRDYFVEVINETSNTVVRNCKGSLDMSNEEIRGSTVWENQSETIDIGHTALLCLFEVTTFEKESERTHTFLYFHRENHVINDESEQSYKNKLDKSLKVFVQSDNAQFPSKPLNKTIRQFINEAIQE